PPEQWDGESSEVSDIFSIGRTMYFMLTGEHPPDSPYKRLDFQGKIIDKKLADIVIIAAEPEIKDRYSTVVEVIRSLEALKKGKPGEFTKETARLIVGAKTYPLGSFMTIGSDCFGIGNILIPDPDPKGPYIEKIHAVIKKETEKYWLYDNHSRFGTFVEEPGRKILLTSRKDVVQYLKDRGYISPHPTLEKRLLKDGDFISLAWDPILGDYIKLQFRELN
ncbi:MAG: FHA domain-containing protein, partial [ANME-2 cluster archaeon]